MPAESAPAEPSAAQKLLGDFAPKLLELTEETLFGDVWERPGLSKRDRSLITVAALVSLYRTGQLEGHLRRALANGVTQDELIEAITHLAFYAGWPSAMTGITMLKEIVEQADEA
jgi:4-carboxymuconolactone decarboxylase